jgi:hypothetical protein
MGQIPPDWTLKTKLKAVLSTNSHDEIEELPGMRYINYALERFRVDKFSSETL